jgi:hypothetical protein
MTDAVTPPNPPADAAREARPPLEQLGTEEKNDEKVARVDGQPKSAHGATASQIEVP